MKTFEQFYNEGITPEPDGGWQVKPEMEKWLEDKYREIYDNWVPVKRVLMTGDIPDYTVFPGKPAERKMGLQDISPSKSRGNGMVDWIRSNIKQVIVTAGRWVNNDVETNSNLIFDAPVEKEQYQAALSKFRARLVGFGNDPQTMWHIMDIRNAREVAPAVQRAIDELFDLTREIIHYNRERDYGEGGQTPDRPNPGEHPPGSPSDH